MNKPVYRTPIVQPDLSPETVDHAITETLTVAAPFLSVKVRARIYTVAGAIGVICIAAAPVVGGLIGDVLGGIGAAATAASSVTALSHISG